MLDNEEIKMIEILNTGVFDVNTMIVWICDNFVFVVDSSAGFFTGDEDKVVSYLKKQGLQPVLFLHTHGHFDHIMGSAVLKTNWPDVPLCVHEADSNMSGSCAFECQANDLCLLGLEDVGKGLKNLPDADILLHHGQSLADAIESSNKNVCQILSEWTIFHTPGHTPGSICVYNKKNRILISGDTLFYRSWGRTDLKGGDDALMSKSLSFLEENVDMDARVFPGHGYAGFSFKVGKIF